MEQVLLIIHLLIAVALVVVVLLQRSEGGALGMGGGSGGGGGMGMFSARGAANALTRTTAILAACFLVTSLALAILAGGARDSESIFDSAPAPGATLPQSQTEAPADPSAPVVPTSE
ncbi:preprotein translocase subunit SecG [Rhodospirillaceae bacterium KN72]|uniref:Protein-export membrane protein SecG n=1 Tax=Pacificispira spongiicola TaxID=2729598 RepID=A0A7Y0DYM9_9PROT|nr:preprotein translocase subunit SecG [Pacificispira spongiicola]NMM44009.1 preprotein translocase subunit SecG [Pacificispira spongiicola]